MQICWKGDAGGGNSKSKVLGEEEAQYVCEMVRCPLCWSEGVTGVGRGQRVTAEGREGSCAGWCRPEREGGREQGEGWEAPAKLQGDGNGSSGQIWGLC